MRGCLLGLVIALLTVNAAETQSKLPTRNLYCGAGDPGRTPEQEEAQCLGRLGSIARRDGDVLYVMLENGKSTTFQSESKACEEGAVENCIAYSLYAYLPSQKAFLLSVSWWEGGGFAFVSRRSGHITKLESEPHFSPNGKYFVTVKGSEAEPVDKAIAVFSTATDPPKLEFSYIIPEGRYALHSFVGWDGNGRIKLAVYTRAEGKRDPEDFDAEVVRTAAGWELKSPPLGP